MLNKKTAFPLVVLAILACFLTWQSLENPSLVIPSAGSAGASNATPEEIRQNAKTVGANELGQVPVFSYHQIDYDQSPLSRTPEEFRSDLQELYDRNYVLISLSDYITGSIDIPAGKSPAVLTFDGGSPGQFRLLEQQNGGPVPDPDSAVGILMDFSSKHPGFGHTATFFANAEPFGQPQYLQDKLQMLNQWGFEIESQDFDLTQFKRIQVFADNGRSSLVNWLDRISGSRYVSDGRNDTTAVPGGWEKYAKDEPGKRLVTYTREEPYRTPAKDLLSSNARGVHVSFAWAGSTERWNEVLALVDSAKLNTVQLDVKDETGRIGYGSQVGMAVDTGAGESVMPVNERLKDLKDRGVYSIARIVVFRDPFLAQARPDLMVRASDGSPLAGGVWVDPYSKEVQDYNLALAVEAYQLGFDEVQLDYIRFPEGLTAETALYNSKTGSDTRGRVDVIADYLSYSRSVITWDRPFSATVFGFMSIALDDQGIGQRPERMAPFVDYLSPMSYPSHYGPGNYGFDNPNAHPYEVIDASLKGFQSLVESSGCRLRPWLQGFSMGQPPYGRDEIRAQINATEDNNINTWLLWNSGVSYQAEEIAE
ncbi:putative glycoside hydrolase [Pelotomaculum propionicicum]|uniref:putative glycoside hydrolase n=1 Tax=Pelotomaculum propionicicum TaxID=258475 RepID=UPI003B796A7C